MAAAAAVVAATGRPRPIGVGPGRGDSVDPAHVEVEGVVTDALTHAMFRVELADGTEVLAHLSGRTRRLSVKVLPGDRVRVELSPIDPSRGRIIHRFR